MPHHVSIKCPVCHEELEVSLTIINDSEGDGIYEHHFTAIDDYTIDWNGHATCFYYIEAGKDPVMTELEATIIQAGFNLIDAGDVHDIDPY